MTREFIRAVELAPYRPGSGPTFRLELYDERRTEGRKQLLSYDLTQVEQDALETLIFEHREIAWAGVHSVDSDQALYEAVTYATLRPGPGGDDPELFSSYTENQLTFAQAHAESLALEALRVLDVDE